MLRGDWHQPRRRVTAAHRITDIGVLHPMAQPSGEAACSARLRVAIAERLLVAGLRAQERADEADAARRRLAFLFEASQQLAASLEPAAVVQALADLIVPDFGDGAVVHVLEPGPRGGHTRIASSGVLGGRPPEWWDWLERFVRPGVKRATHLAVSQLGSTRKKGPPPNPRGGGELTFLIVPLRARGRTLGTLTIVASTDRQPYGPDEIALAEALGNQAGLALDNAQLYEEQRRMVERLEGIRGELDVVRSEWLRDDERRRIARDLHDHVEQTFFAIGLTATAALEDPDTSASQARWTQTLACVADLSNAGSEELRRAIFALNDADLAAVGLVPALWKLVTSFQQRTGVETDLVFTGAQRQVPTEVVEVLHATAREALANVERHARAGAVVLGLHVSARSISLTVHDDGAGASRLVLKRIANSTTHFGLRSLRERVRRLHGTFASGPGPDGGFLVRARIPLQSGGIV
jgi:signal transduction histidine kinase